jgi:O-antigen ligase
MLLITASVGLRYQLPELSLGIHLQVPDLLLLALLGCIAVRRLVVPEFRMVRTPLDRPLLIFYGFALFSTVVAVARSSLEIPAAVQGIRVLSYYLTFFVVTNLIRERFQLNRLLNGIFLLAVIVAVEMVFEPDREVQPPGFGLILFSFVTSLCVLVSEKFKPMALVRGLQCALMGMGCLLAFRRSWWVVLVLALSLVAYLVKGGARRTLIGWGVVLMSPAMLVLLVVFNAPDLPLSRLLQGAWDRLNTVNVGAVTGGDDNYNYRRIENGYALSAIASSPVMGLGLGARYRPLDPRLDEYDPRTGGLMEGREYFMHNSHLQMLMQSGLLGYLSLTWLSLAFLLRGFRNWRKIANARKGAVILGFTLVYLVVLIAAWANNVFMNSSWVPLLGMVMGINEVILQQSRTVPGART